MDERTDYLDRLVDEERLRSYLASVFGDADRFEFERHQAGHSNETLFLTWGDRRLVLRRPPPGDTAESAHDVAREYRAMSALADTAVPVPPTVALCEDHSVIGSDFYLMERVEGEVIRLAEPDRFAEARHRERLGERLVDVLATVHTVDYRAVGLADFGRPEGYMRRQVDRWQKQLSWAVGKTGRGVDLPHRREIEAWLDDECPTESERTLVHGDYKLDNVIVGPDAPPEIVAVVDWELSTLGDPLADLGWMLLFWHDNPDTGPLVPELIPRFTAAEGYPTRRDLIDRYEERTDGGVDNLTFYQVFAAYKLAAVCEMFYARHLSGDSENPIYPAMKERVPAITAYAHAAMKGERAW